MESGNFEKKIELNNQESEEVKNKKPSLLRKIFKRIDLKKIKAVKKSK
jgi:hypothetical protein